MATTHAVEHLPPGLNDLYHIMPSDVHLYYPYVNGFEHLIQLSLMVDSASLVHSRIASSNNGVESEKNSPDVTQESVCISPTAYDSALIQHLLTYHRQACELNGGTQYPYFESASMNMEGLGNEENFVYNERFGDIRLIAARVADLNIPFLTQIVHHTMSIYVESGTMGTQFPKGDAEQESQLAAVFCDMHPDDVVLCFVAQSPDCNSSVPLAGVKIARGQTDNTVLQIQHGADASLPTLQSLRLKNSDTFFGSEAFRAGLQMISEVNLVCGSRFFSSDLSKTRVALQEWGITVPTSLLHLKTLAALLVRLIPHVYALDADNLHEPVPKGLICDTHIKGLTESLQLLGGIVVASDGALEPTPAVTKSILHYHYGDEVGGHLKKIDVVYLPSDKFLATTKEQLDKVNQSLRADNLPELPLAC